MVNKKEWARINDLHDGLKKALQEESSSVLAGPSYWSTWTVLRNREQFFCQMKLCQAKGVFSKQVLAKLADALEGWRC